MPCGVSSYMTGCEFRVCSNPVQMTNFFITVEDVVLDSILHSLTIAGEAAANMFTTSEKDQRNELVTYLL